MKVKFLNADSLAARDRLVFKICLPCLLFVDIATARQQTGDILNVKLIIFCVAAVTASFLIPCLVVPLFVKDNAKRGAFIQGVYRSNAAILGTTLAKNLFGDDGTATLATILPFIVTLFNVFAVVILSVYAPADAKLSPAALAKRIVKTVATNPLIHLDCAGACMAADGSFDAGAHVALARLSFGYVDAARAHQSRSELRAP